MANININRNVADAFYRYKMPRIIAKVEGKGNGIKTVITNMTEVAKSLQRPPTYPTKYFGCELGAQTQFDPKNDRYIVNGAHDCSRLQDLLDGFIKRFVLCEECDNPETFFTVKAKQGIILSRCIACGHQFNIDMRHKLTTFIIKNPPDMEIPNGSTPNKKDKRAAKAGKGGKKVTNGDASPEAHKDEEEGMVGPDTPPEPIQNGKDEDDDDWGDVSEDAVKQRMQELTSAARNLAINDDLEKTPQERMDMLYEFIKQKKAADEIVKCSKEIYAEAERLDLKDKCPLLLVEILLDEGILAQAKKYRTTFCRFTHQNKKAQRYLLGGLEQLIGNVYHDTLVPKVPHIFKTFYDLDILEEEIILEWGAKVSKKYVAKEIAKEIHEKAQPFIKWLAEAEEESSEEDEDDVEIVYDERAPVGLAPKEPAKPAAAAPAEEEDDLDIDAI